MKRLLFVLSTILFTGMVNAKTYQFGDLIEKDGVTAIVVYVDQSGEHGLMMTPRAFFSQLTEESIEAKKEIERRELKQIFALTKSTAKKYGVSEEDYAMGMNAALEAELDLLDKAAVLPIMPSCKWTKAMRKEYDQHIKALLSSNTEFGKDNQKMIAEYCLNNGIAMDVFFPQFYWASQLGDDWFIPGNHELELFGLNFIDKIGVDYMTMALSKKEKERFDNYNKKTGMFEKKRARLNCFSGDGLGYMIYPNVIASSTMTLSGWIDNNADKCWKYNKKGTTFFNFYYGDFNTGFLLKIGCTFLTSNIRYDNFTTYTFHCAMAEF